MCAPFSANAQTNGYALSVNGGSTTNLTLDLNGNMTSDGTNAYAWDAENRMIKITYPGSNNFSTFVYDGLSRNVSIVETTAGSVTSTKQFVWVADERKEERDGSGTLTKKFFNRGQMNGATKYFYDLDHLGSVREMTDNSGVAQCQYAFDPFGRVTKISETVASDFGYAGYYFHSRSGLHLTRTRAYNSSFGRWFSRDPIRDVTFNLTPPAPELESSEMSSPPPISLWSVLDAGFRQQLTKMALPANQSKDILENQYAYVSNRPVNLTDPSGLKGIFPNPDPRPCLSAWPDVWFGCAALCAWECRYVKNTGFCFQNCYLRCTHDI